MAKNVLIVDADQDLLLSPGEGRARYREAFRVLMAGDGAAALDRLRETPVSLVVTDLKMPGMDGFALLGHIMDQYPEIPVMIMTGYGTPRLEEVVRRGGAVGFIEKPFQIDEVARMIIAVLGKEADGGTLHGISPGTFLQLMELEQKTCTLRVTGEATGQQGVLFFREGDLLEARADGLKGEAAVYEIASWEGVTISIQNTCMQKEKRIRSDLFAILLESMRMRDEAAEKKAAQPQPSDLGTGAERSEQGGSPDDARTAELGRRLRERLGERSRVREVFADSSWDSLLAELARIGEPFHAGALALAYIDNGGPAHVILVPGPRTTVVTVDPACPRDRTMEVIREA